MKSPRLDNSHVNGNDSREPPEKTKTVVHELRVPLRVHGDPFAMLVVADPKLVAKNITPIKSTIELFVEFGRINWALNKHRSARMCSHDLTTFIKKHLNRIAHLLVRLMVAELFSNSLPSIGALLEANLGQFMSGSAERSILGLIRLRELKMLEECNTASTIHPALSTGCSKWRVSWSLFCSHLNLQF
jgi:hypothetical protein